MDKYVKRVLGIAIILLVIIILVCYGFISESKKAEKESQKKVDKCNEIEGCDKWECLADLESLYDAQRNLLLRHQNCLLKKEKG